MNMMFTVFVKDDAMPVRKLLREVSRQNRTLLEAVRTNGVRPASRSRSRSVSAVRNPN